MRAAVDRSLGQALQWRNLTSADGQYSVRYREGVRMLPEMQNLMHVLAANGIDVWVVTASFEQTVKALACPDDFGYNVPLSNVLGIRLTTENGGSVSSCPSPLCFVRWVLVSVGSSFLAVSSVHQHNRPQLARDVQGRQGERRSLCFVHSTHLLTLFCLLWLR
jgi:hypothetical protein